MSSIADRFTVAATGDVEIIQCLRCAHRVEGQYPIACPAFPAGIPKAILTNEHDHHKPYPGDHGYRFRPADAEPYKPLSKVKP